MLTVELSGWGTVLRLVTLTPKLLKELTESGVDEDRLDEIFNDRYKSEIGFSGISSNYQILVNEKPIDPNLIKQIPIIQSDPEVIKSGETYLVREEEQKGSWFRFEIKKKFNPSKYEITTETLTLPDGVSFQIYRAEYEQLDDFGETSGVDLKEYVILKNGKRVDIKKND